MKINRKSLKINRNPWEINSIHDRIMLLHDPIVETNMKCAMFLHLKVNYTSQYHFSTKNSPFLFKGEEKVEDGKLD